MRRLILILMISGSSLIYGQQLNFLQVDTLTYNQYLREEWPQLIESGKTALENDINYYYLQMRIAYAYFSLEKYRQAIAYYNNALDFSSSDPLASEYLYYSYLYSGRVNDALAMTTRLTNEQRQVMGIDMLKKFVSFGLSHAWSTSDASMLQDAVLAGTSSSEDGVQKASIGVNAPKLELSHRFGKRVILNHSASMIFKNELSYAVVNSVGYLSPEQAIRQFEYGIDADILLAEGLILSPGIGFISTSIPVYLETSYGVSAGRDRTSVGEVTLRNWVEKIYLEKQFTFLDIGLSYVHNNFNLTSTQQLGLHTTIYPMANLNLYFTLDAYGQILRSNGLQKTAFIAKPLLGFRVHKNLWLELSGTLPEQFNFYDVRNAIAFNNIEKTAGTLEAYAIIPMYRKNAKLFFGYQYRNTNSYFFPENNLLEPYNKLMYNNHLITGGIKWTK